MKGFHQVATKRFDGLETRFQHLEAKVDKITKGKGKKVITDLLRAPLNNFEEVAQFEKRLQDPDFMEAQVCFELKEICLKAITLSITTAQQSIQMLQVTVLKDNYKTLTAHGTMKRVVCRLGTPRLWKKYSLRGSYGKKRALCQSPMHNLILGNDHHHDYNCVLIRKNHCAVVLN